MAPLLPAEPPPFFANLAIQYFYGENLELLNSSQPFDTYSFFQYIFDIGIHKNKEFSTLKNNPSLILDGVGRFKGIFGNDGFYTKTTLSPIKIGWTKVEVSPTQELGHTKMWLRELALTINPQEENHSFFKIGLFPYKLGNGLTLGNAYVLQAPIPGQFIYEQIDQFRPGILCSLTHHHNQLSADLYLGINAAQNNAFSKTASFINFQNLEVPFKERSSGKGNFLVVAQCFITPEVTQKKLTVNPYLLFNHNGVQQVEFPEDATSKLFSLGISGIYQSTFVRFNVECAKNFGHQHVKKWDRNQLIQTNGLTNTQLFYASNTALTLANVTLNDFTLSPLVIRPSTIAQSYGNGTNFLYSIEPKSTFIFKNSYDRYRNGYDNTYTGWMLYADILLTEKYVSWGVAGGCASGGQNPNDSYEKIMLTRLTPGITYLDYNKKYHGFVGIEQLFEGKSINPLFFGQAQKFNAQLTSLSEEINQVTSINFTNQGFLGTTFRFEKIVEQKKISLSGTIATYFQLTALKKGIGASLWQEQSIDFTEQMRADMDTLLSKALGTELNASFDFIPFPDFTFSVLGALFIPGSYYKSITGKSIPLKLQSSLDLPNFSPDEDSPITIGSNFLYFLSAKMVCLFDLTDWKDVIPRKKQKEN